MALYGHISQVVNTHLSNKSNPHNVTAYQIGAAPTGFGLGDSGKHCADCNEAIQSGFYALSGETCVNVPADMRYSPMIVSRRFGTIIQFVDNGISSIRRVITNYGSTDPNKPLTYGEWEWINPPMKFGVPYRTIKRFLNKPVYTIAQSLGSLPNNGAKEVALGVLNISNVVSTQPTIYLPSRMVPGSNSYNCGCSIVNKDFEPLFNVELYRGSDNIEYVGVHTHMDLSDRQGHIVVEYTVD